MTKNNKHERRYCSQTGRLGGLCSSCVAGHFLFRISGDRVQFLFAEHNPDRIADSCYLAFDWMEISEKENKHTSAEGLDLAFGMKLYPFF